MPAQAFLWDQSSERQRSGALGRLRHLPEASRTPSRDDPFAQRA